jgi:acetyl-CoA C-acetyltransferase
MKLGKLWSQHSRIAANHPNAWSKKIYTATEITSKTPFNRMVAFPYRKLMNPFVTVDLGAAIILMSEERSRKFRQNRKFRQKENRPVYFIGGGYAKDRQRFLIEKSSFTSSPPLKAAVDKALQRSALTLDKIEAFDLYSCFPCAVGMALKMLGLEQNDKRPFTVTGGLGFFGGPGNNYSLHAVATMVEMIAKGKINNGLVTSLGWFMHKHAAGIYSATPAETDLRQHDLDDAKAPLAGSQPVPIAEKVTGKGRIETYTVIYKKDGTPNYSVIYGKTEKGLRFIANSNTDFETIMALTTQNQVGKAVQLQYNDQERRNLAHLL